MKNFVKTFFDSLEVAKKDKWIIVLSIIPVMIGLLLFYYIGSWVFSDLKAWGDAYIKSKVDATGWGTFFGYLMIGILGAAFYFFINWFFVLAVSVIASPFNDLISSRVEKVFLGQEALGIGESVGNMFSKIISTIKNELKKISFILIVTVFAFIMSLFPILSPVSIALSATLMAVSFLDYSWSRHSLPFRDCLNNVKKSFLSYLLGGIVFMGIVAIPFVNVICLPYAVIYFTILYCKSLDKVESPDGEIVS